MKSRVDIIKEVDSKVRTKREYLCIEDNKITKNLRVVKRIGTPSINGETFLGEVLPLRSNIKVAIKKIPIEKNDLKYIDKPYDLKSIQNSTVFSELYFLKLTSILVKKNITPNLPILYKYFVCNKCSFENEEVNKHYPGVNNCILAINELADGDFKEILKSKNYTTDQLITYYFQIFIGIYCIRKYFGIWHHDLHYGNVLFHRIPPGGYIHYIVDGKDIFIPNFGLIFVLWDFGYARIPKVVQNKALNFIYRKEKKPYEDYNRITYMASSSSNKTSNDAFEGLHALINRYSKLPQVDMISSLGEYINKTYNIAKPQKEKIYGPFNTDKEI